jgi:hypothetical protein
MAATEIQNTLPLAVPAKKVPKMDLRSVIIVAILSFAAGAYGASEEPTNASTPAAATGAPAASEK